jgi:hypothetical protein
MSHWKRLSGKRRAAILAVVLLVLATTAWGSSQLASLTESVKPAHKLDAPLLPPDEVFIQKANGFGEYGNVLVSVRLSDAQLAAKTADGTRDYIVIGSPEAPVVLRDDGQGGDAAAADGLFTGLAFIDEPQLAARGSSDAAEWHGRAVRTTPRFVGRSAVDVYEPQPFDYEGFRGGGRVRLGPAVAFLEPETYVPPDSVPGEPGEGTSEALVSSKSVFVPKLTSATPVVEGTNAFQDRVLMIRDVGVVTDPTRTYDPCTDTGNPAGVWTFNHLMTEMANPAASGINPADFVRAWLENWLNTGLTVNGDAAPARPLIQNLINLWPKTADGKLDLAKSPLRLLSINPRIDLRRTAGGGFYSNNVSGNFLDAGEARFIFGFALKVPAGQDPNSLFLGPVELPPASNRCFALPFTVILEYRIPKCDCKDVKSWARQWMELADDPLGSPRYNARLEALTEQFVTANANPRNPNGSALGQLRTNEVAISTFPPTWELREFQLTQFPFTFLQETTSDDTPQNRWQNTTLLRDWILAVKPSLSGPDFEDPIAPVPLLFTGSAGISENFLAGESLVPPPITDFLNIFWRAPGLNLADPQENWARHRVARASCNGCHRRETFTHFVHVEPGKTMVQSVWNDSLSGGLGNWVDNPPRRSDPSLPAELSQFLTGINGLGDAASSPNPRSPNRGTPTRNFDDLARREEDIKRVGKLACFRFHPANADLVRRTLAANGKLPPNLYEGIPVVPVDQRVSVAVDDMTANHISEVH